MARDKRFSIIENTKMGFSSYAKIIVDNETGVNYLFYGSGSAGGLTPLLDSKGNVVIAK